MRTRIFSRGKMLRAAFLFATGLLTALPGMTQANVTHAPARVTSEVNDAVRVTLHGSVTGAARPEFDLGPVDAATPMTHVRLLLQRSPQQEAALEKYMAEQLNPHSPNYHKWLTPDQLGTLYGPADSDVAAVTGWLQSRGLTVNLVPKSRIFVDFTGSTAQVQEAFGVSIHNFSMKSQKFQAAVSEPQIPAALKPVVSGVFGLNSSMLKHMVIPAGSATIDRQNHKIAYGNSSKPKAMFTVPNGGSYFLGITPSDAATMYDTPNPTFNANYASGSGPAYDGTGISIGVGGAALVNTAPLVNYRQIFMGDSKAPTIVNDWGATLSSDGEADLDLEFAGAMAPGANIYYYPSPDLFSGVVQAAEDNIVDIFSLSYGGCELFDGDSANQFFSQMWQQFAAQGITVNTAGGDSGSAGCDYYNGAEPAASYGLAVSGLATTPYNVAVGGTDTWGLIQNFFQYASTTNNALYGSVLGYMPESTMNASSWPNQQLADNMPQGNAVGSGGGPSSCVTTTTDSGGNTVCTAGWPKPSWQSAPGVPKDGVRDIPDVSLLMSAGVYNSAWLTCNDADDCSQNIALVGGTSASTPAFAGIEALIAQKAGGRLGQLAPELYTLASGSNAGKIFHDITIGNNSMDCVAGTPDCAANAAGYDYLTGWNSGTGYDYTTGLGSVDAAQLIAAWPAYSSNLPTVTVTPLEANIVATQTAVINVSVAPASGSTVPTGTVTLNIAGAAFVSGFYTSSPATLSSTGQATFTVPASLLGIITGSPTSFNLNVIYSGDKNFSPASGTGVLNVYSSLAATSTTVVSSASTIGDATPFTLTATVAPATATGTVSFNAVQSSGTVSLGSAALSSGTATLQVKSLPVGTWAITAYYSGDAGNAASVSSAAAVTVEQGSFTVAASPASLTVRQGQSGTASITVTPAYNYTGVVGWSVSSGDTTGSLASNATFCLSAANVTGSNAVSSTLTVYTTPTSCPGGNPISQAVRSIGGPASLGKPASRIQPAGMAAGLAGLLLAGLIGWRARRLRLLAVLLAAISFGFGLSGCSNSSGNSVARGTYTVTLTGYDTNNSGATGAVQFNLTVN